MTSGYLTLAFVGGPQEGRIAAYPLHSQRSPKPSMARESEMGASPLPSQGPKGGRHSYVTDALLGVANAKRVEKVRRGYLTPAFSGAWKRAELLCNPCILGGPEHKAQRENQKWLTHPRTLVGPQEGGLGT